MSENSIKLLQQLSGSWISSSSILQARCHSQVSMSIYPATETSVRYILTQSVDFNLHLWLPLQQIAHQNLNYWQVNGNSQGIKWWNYCNCCNRLSGSWSSGTIQSRFLHYIGANEHIIDTCAEVSMVPQEIFVLPKLNLYPVTENSGKYFL